MEPKSLGYEDLLLSMKRVVHGHEDDVYNKISSVECLYYRNGHPSCLIGHVLADLGLPVKIAPDGTAAHLEGKAADLVLWDAYDVTDERALTLARNAQRVQDNGGTWGDAVTFAVEQVAKGDKSDLEDGVLQVHGPEATDA